MKLKKNNSQYPIISSDDVYMTGETTGQNLSNIVNEHDKDINDLKKYTKWLYKYGGTGSKYGPYNPDSPTTTFGASILINGKELNASKENQIILNGEKTVTISGVLSGTIATNTYAISIKKGNGSTYLTTSGRKINGVPYDIITSDSWYQFNYETGIDDNTTFTIIIICTGSENKAITYTANVVKEAYTFALSFADDNHKQIISTDNDLWIDGTASVRDTGLSLNITYNVIAQNPIKFELIGDDISTMFDIDNLPGHDEEDNSYSGYINLNAIRQESVYIPFNTDFLNDDDSIGYYSITVAFTVKEDGQAIQTVYKQISFNLIPQNSYFFKVMPVNPKQKFYKYNAENLDTINETYQEYDLLYKAYVKTNVNNESLTNKAEVISKLREKYNSNISDDISDEDLKTEIQSAVSLFENNIYVYPTGNVKFYVTAYYGTDTSYPIDIEGELNGRKASIGMTQITLKTKETVSLNISESGVYTFSFFTPTDTSRKITYYMYVYDKVTEINWYGEGVQVMNENYWRTGATTPAFSKYTNVYNIQKYNNDVGKTNIVTLGASAYPTNVNDIMVSFGIQYSANNTSVANPIIEILAKTNASEEDSNKNHISIYQNKVTTNSSDIPIYLPKEDLYNVKDNSKYHLLTIYKRFIYNVDNKDYYEICIYLDGCLENACNTFTSDNSPLITINLLPGNFAINLAEITYFMHNDSENEEGVKQYNLPRVAKDGSINDISYLDDIAISEYYYKFVSINYNTETIPAYEMVKKTIKQLRGFGEVSNGMIKVADQSIINDIAKEGSVPVMLFEHSDITKGEFIKFYTASYAAESSRSHLKLDSLRYSSGKADLTEIRMPSIPGQGNVDQSCNWYIELQGSSTLLNFAKNLNVGIEQGLGGYMILFTPNFKYVNFNDSSVTTAEKKEAKNTYLPETKFTLKTDQVDSTHSNNTAVGAFVNSNTTPFVNSTSNNYSNYIKNCLLGFPVLVFIKVNEFTGENEIRTESYYFLGIMNFNLGRDSYFNMGYYSTDVLSHGDCDAELQQLDGSTFKTVYIETGDHEKTELPIRNDVIVAEIQGGDPHFDFSQANPSVLFPYNASDGHVMFGDFVPRYTYGSSDRDIKMQAHLHRLVEGISLSGGYLFEMIGKHFGEYEEGYNGHIAGESIFTSANQVPNYMIQYERIPGKGAGGEPLYSIPNGGIRSQRSAAKKFEDLRNLILDYDDESSGEHNNAVLDYKSISEYYVICMAFGLVDSVMKNLNVKTWSASDDITEDKIQGKWFAAFYDMDTAFGRNNGGTATSYFAFSDYWFNTSTELSVATIYRDFYPVRDVNSTETVKNIGYDVPSSYLFAISKYAPLAFSGAGTSGDLFSAHRQYTPQNIWARWRTINTDSITISKLGANGISELKNADYFIDKYFIRNLDEIPEQIWNMNYRLKYLKRIVEDSTLDNGDLYTYDTVSGAYELTLNKRPFHGKGINELREWLAGRLHILDAYFNIEGNGKSDQYPILKLNYDGTEESNLVNTYTEDDPQSGATYTFWQDQLNPIKLEGGEYSWVESGYYDNVPDDTINALYTNEDIILLSDIFSASRQGNKYDNNIALRFNAREYSPVLVVNAMGSLKKYLIEDPNIPYLLEVRKTGTTNSLFGGAANWTWIENLNSIIVNGGIYVRSNNLESVVLTQGKCSDYTLLTPALKEVSITEPLTDEGNYTEFSGRLTFAITDGNDSYPCLDKVDISRTSIELNITGEGVKIVNLASIDSPSVMLSDCPNLSSVNLTGAKITSCTITPGWSHNISISNSKIKDLKISAKETDNERKEFSLNYDQAIESIELDGFTHITITDCPKLASITIKNAGDVKSIKLIRCNVTGVESEHQLLSVTTYSKGGAGAITNDDVTREFPLTYFTQLEEISLQGTFGIKKLDFTPCAGVTYIDKDGGEHHGIDIVENGFSSTDIATIITNEAEGQVLFINGPATFNDCAYTYGNNTLYVKRKVTSLANMFCYSYYRTSGNVPEGKKINNIMVAAILNNFTAEDFKPTIYEDISKITNISNMFSGQTQIIVDDVRLGGTGYKEQLEYLSLKNFPNIRNASGIYSYCQVKTLDASLFGNSEKWMSMNLGDNDSLTINSFVTASNINVEIHTLKYIIEHLSSLIAYESMGLTMRLFDETNPDASIFEFRELFRDREDNIRRLPKLTEFTGFDISSETCVDWTDAFIYYDNGTRKFMFPNLIRVSYSFNRTSQDKNPDYNRNLDEWGLSLHDKKLTVFRSFTFSLTTPIDYMKVVDINLYQGLVPVTGSEFSMPKYIEEADFITLLKTINLPENAVTNLDYKFQYVTILKSDSTDNEFKTHDINDLTLTEFNFTSCNYAFYQMKFKVDKDDTEVIPILFTQDSIKLFTKVTHWAYAFAGITMEKNLPLNFFNKRKTVGTTTYKPTDYNRNIRSMEGMFMGTSITSTETYFRHELYDGICIPGTTDLDVETYNNGVALDGSYHSEILVSGLNRFNVTVDNPKSKNKRIDGDDIYYGEDIINHFIVPFDIFYGCAVDCNIQSCFENSDIEGILPSLLLANNKSSALNRTFKNTLVIPNRIYNKYGKDFVYLETELLDNMSERETACVNAYLKIDNAYTQGSTNPVWYQRHKTYAFVPRGFTTNTSLNEAFNFKLILPLSVANAPDAHTDNPHNSLYEQYFVFTSESIQCSSLISFTKSLPGVGQHASGPEYGDLTYDLYYINPLHPNNQGQSDVPAILDPRTYHNIHYSLLLVEPTEENQYVSTPSDNSENMTFAILGQLLNDYNVSDVSQIGNPLKYGISYLHYGMTLTQNLRDVKLEGFMNPLLLRFLFGNIFKPTANGEATALNITASDSVTYDIIFDMVEGISRYCKMPTQGTYYNNAIGVNLSRIPILVSYYNCGNATSYANYTNKDKYTNVDPFRLDNGESYNVYV